MPAKRRYNVKGTYDYLVMAIIFLFLGTWAIKDGWFPSEKTLKKHPLEVNLAFEVRGSVDKVFVEKGDSVSEKMTVATLRSEQVKAEYEKAIARYSETKKERARLGKEEGAEAAEKLAALEKEMAGLYDEVEDLKTRMDNSELKIEEGTKGKVKDVLIKPHSMVEAGETVIVVDPKDHFYPFNKSLAIISFILFAVFMVIHTLGR